MEQFSIVAWLVDKFGLPASWGTTYLHIVMASIVALFITIISIFAWQKLKRTESMILPKGQANLVNIIEVLISAVFRLSEDVMGPEARSHIPLIASLFVYILISNLIGVIPGFVPSTENINTNFSCAIVVFIYYNVVGIKRQGIKKYFRNLAGPVIWLAPLLFAIELVSHLVRPVSLSVRLFGNIFGDHMVLGMFSQLVPFLIPIIFMGLAIFVSFMQAFVFTLLTIVYIHMALQSEEH